MRCRVSNNCSVRHIYLHQSRRRKYTSVFSALSLALRANHVCIPSVQLVHVRQYVDDWTRPL